MWYLVYSLVKGAVAFHSRGKKVGDVRPVNIFVNEHGEIKIGCNLSWPAEKDNYRKWVDDGIVTFLGNMQLK